MADLTSRRSRYAAACGVAVLTTAALLLSRVLVDFLAATLMTDAYQSWCDAGGKAGNEYGLNCEQTTGIFDAATRTRPADLVLVVLLVISGMAILRGRGLIRAAGCLVPAATPLWGYLTWQYAQDLPERLAGAAVLEFPDLVPGWYTAIGTAVAIALLVVPAAGVLAQIAGAVSATPGRNEVQERQAAPLP